MSRSSPSCAVSVRNQVARIVTTIAAITGRIVVSAGNGRVS